MIMQIGSTDITGYIVSGGFEWERNTVDAPNSGRDMNGTMRRKIITTKDKLSITCRDLSQSELSTLVGLLSHNTISVTYFCPATADNRTATFYGSNIKSATIYQVGGQTKFSNIAFNVTEV